MRDLRPTNIEQLIDVLSKCEQETRSLLKEGLHSVYFSDREYNPRYDPRLTLERLLIDLEDSKLALLL